MATAASRPQQQQQKIKCISLVKPRRKRRIAEVAVTRPDSSCELRKLVRRYMKVVKDHETWRKFTANGTAHLVTFAQRLFKLEEKLSRKLQKLQAGPFEFEAFGDVVAEMKSFVRREANHDELMDLMIRRNRISADLVLRLNDDFDFDRKQLKRKFARALLQVTTQHDLVISAGEQLHAVDRCMECIREIWTTQT
jgi:hypothetical protein